MKRLKDLFLFLGLEAISVVWAALSFALIPSKIVASALAGGYFLVFSLFVLVRILRWPKWWEAWTLYPLLVFLFGCTIPMLWVRFTHLSQTFSDIRILGMTGPEFHHVSTATMGLLFLVTLAEAVSEVFKARAA